LNTRKEDGHLQYRGGVIEEHKRGFTSQGHHIHLTIVSVTNHHSQGVCTSTNAVLGTSSNKAIVLRRMSHHAPIAITCLYHPHHHITPFHATTPLLEVLVQELLDLLLAASEVVRDGGACQSRSEAFPVPARRKPQIDIQTRPRSFERTQAHKAFQAPPLFFDSPNAGRSVADAS